LAEAEAFADDFGGGVEGEFVGFAGGEQFDGLLHEGFQVILGLVGVGDVGGKEQYGSVEVVVEDGGQESRQGTPAAMGFQLGGRFVVAEMGENPAEGRGMAVSRRGRLQQQVL